MPEVTDGYSLKLHPGRLIADCHSHAAGLSFYGRGHGDRLLDGIQFFHQQPACHRSRHLNPCTSGRELYKVRVVKRWLVNFNGGGGDYHLLSTSPYHNDGTDGTDLGADIDKVNSAR